MSPEGLVFEPFREDDAMMRFIGRIGIHAGPEGAILRVEARPEAANPQGILHGGALSALCDVAMYESAKAAFGGDCVTGSQEMKFLRPFFAERPLYVVTEVLRAGRSATHCAARVLQDGRLGAFSTAQFAGI